MSKILVTGASGNIGRKTLQQLLKRKPASELIGLVRDSEKAANLAAAGIELRRGDYLDRDALVRAFTGVDKVMLVSATAFCDRNAQHENVIRAAREAGVRHLVYMPVISKEGSGFVLPQVTDQDIFAQENIKASGLDYTFVGHPPFLENIEAYFGSNALEIGIRAPAGDGEAGFASQDDLAQAHAVVLSEPGHENKSYSLYGSPAVSFAEVADILSNINGKRVRFIACPDQHFIDNLTSAGLPEPVARFVLAWVHGINAGEWDGTSEDLEKLLGRKPTTALEFLRSNYPARKA